MLALLVRCGLCSATVLSKHLSVCGALAGTHKHQHPVGAFSHSAGTARAQCAHSANYYGDYPGNSPENHPPAESCTTDSNLKNSNI